MSESLIQSLKDLFKTGMHLETKWDKVVDDYSVENYAVNLVWNYIHFCVNFPLRKSFTKEEPVLLTSSVPRRPLTLQPEDSSVQTTTPWGGTMGATDPLM